MERTIDQAFGTEEKVESKKTKLSGNVDVCTFDHSEIELLDSLCVESGKTDNSAEEFEDPSDKIQVSNIKLNNGRGRTTY